MAGVERGLLERREGLVHRQPRDRQSSTVLCRLMPVNTSQHATPGPIVRLKPDSTDRGCYRGGRALSAVTTCTSKTARERVVVTSIAAGWTVTCCPEHSASRNHCPDSGRSN